MNGLDNIFTRFLYEAPGDDPPPEVESDTGPPDVPDDAGIDDGPPDMGGFDDDLGSDTSGTDEANDGPPDMGGDFGDDNFGDMGEDGGDETADGEGDNKETLELDDKVSAILNDNLYQHYLALITKINSQLTNIRDNSDVLYTLSEDTLEVVKVLEDLDENLRLYVKNKFLNENFSKNKLFYNKCLNLLGLVNKVFDRDIRKGIKEQK